MKRNLLTFTACFFAVSSLLFFLPLRSYAQEGEGGYVEDGSSVDTDDSSFSGNVESGNDGYGQTDEGGVNSRSWGLIIDGSVGRGQTMFGYVLNSTDNSTLGAGRGAGLDMGAMLNVSLFAVKLEYTRSTLNDLKWSQSGVDFEAKGDGHFATLDFLLGLKLFTEADDMGYTHLFAGLRYWSVLRDESSYLVNGTAGIGSPAKYEQAGGGWIFGYRDLSTFPVGTFSLALETGLWFDHAPFSTFDANGTDSGAKAGGAFGFGMNFGVGAALEDLGLLVTVGWKMDLTATEFSVLGISGNLTGAGYSLAYIKAAKEF